MVIVLRQHPDRRRVVPIGRMLGALAGRAQIADADDAEPGEPFDIGPGEIGHRPRTEDHAAADAAAIGRAIAADVAKIMATLQREEAIVAVGQGASFGILATAGGWL